MQAQAQAQAQAQSQAAQAASQAKMQEVQMQAQIDMQKLQAEAQVKAQLMEMEYTFKKELELIKTQGMLGIRGTEQEYKEKLETFKEDRKDERVEKQTVEQSKLISQRQGKRGELTEVDDQMDVVKQLLQ